MNKEKTRIQGIASESVFDDTRPGAFQFMSANTRIGEVFILSFRCPGGCGQLHQCAIENDNKDVKGWSWNKDLQKPTLKPSIKITPLPEYSESDCNWHGFLTDGEFITA